MESLKHRTQISLDDWQYQMLLDISKKTKRSLSGIIRDLITDKFASKSSVKEADTLYGVIGIGSGDGEPAARKHDRYIYREK